MWSVVAPDRSERLGGVVDAPFPHQTMHSPAVGNTGEAEARRHGANYVVMYSECSYQRPTSFVVGGSMIEMTPLGSQCCYTDSIGF